MFRKISLCWVVLVGLLVGCSGGSGRTFDLDSIGSQVSTGLTELQVTGRIGAPNKVDVDGTTRKLTYEGKDGGRLTVTLISDRVTDISRS